MNYEFMLEWVAYLRANPTQKGKNALEKVVRGRTYRCCLGAACHLLKEAHPDGIVRRGDLRRGEEVVVTYVGLSDPDWGSSSYLPSDVITLGGFKNNDPFFMDKGKQRTLSYLNDNGMPWSKIADLIEEHWEEL